jgi:hypothetical protein
MTSKEKVKQVYPEARYFRDWRNHHWYGCVFFRSASLHGAGTVIGEVPVDRESWAWADAWRNIQRRVREITNG